MRSLSLVLGISASLAAQSVKPQDIRRQADGSWVRTQSGSGEAAPAARLQISSQVRVVRAAPPTIA